MEVYKNLNWIKAALLSFIVAGLLGTLLRLAFVIELPEALVFTNIRHAHSHGAMLGWIYSGLFIFIIRTFNLERKAYMPLFWFTQLTVAGMFISFTAWGYNTSSIVLSSLHILSSYVFAFFVFKDLKKDSGQKNKVSGLCLKTSLFFMILSTLGAWALGPILIFTGKSAFYYGTIQFFLHFQFNGWFIFAGLALLFRMMENRDIKIKIRTARQFYYLLTISCFLTFALAITWSNPLPIIYFINSLGVIIQLVALYMLFKLLGESDIKSMLINAPVIRRLWQLSFLCLIMKILIQGFVVIPYIATISYTVRNFVMGFIHLLMLGSISIFLISLIINYYNYRPRLFNNSLYVFILGFALSELLLFMQGLLFWASIGFIPGYYMLLFIVSFIMPVGIIGIFISLKAGSRTAMLS